jgi:hypothetical protein
MPGKKSKGSDAKVKAAAAALREEGELEKLSMNSLVNRYQVCSLSCELMCSPPSLPPFA